MTFSMKPPRRPQVPISEVMEDDDKPESVDSGCVLDRESPSLHVDHKILSPFKQAKEGKNYNTHNSNVFLKEENGSSENEEEALMKTKLFEKLLSKKCKKKKRKREKEDCGAEELEAIQAKHKKRKKINKIHVKDRTSSCDADLDVLVRERALASSLPGTSTGSTTCITTNQTKALKSNYNKGPPKPIYNSNGDLVFSRFDFSNRAKCTWNERKPKPDLKHTLKVMLKEKEKLQNLEDSKNYNQACKLIQNKAWKNAMMKASGKKVKDNQQMVNRSLKRKEREKRVRKKRWDDRVNTMQKQMDTKQHKRKENIQKRKDKRAGKRRQKFIKKGHIVPGF